MRGDMSIITVITAIQDYLSGKERTHYRKVGKQTAKLCKRASKLSVNEHQRRILMSAAISVDEVVAALLGLEQKRNVEAFKDRHTCARPSRKELLAVMRCYLSALLIMCVTFKKMLLSKVEMSENNFMVGWRSVFEYSTADMQLFDEELAPAFRNKGMDGLVEALGRHMINTLFQEKQPLSKMEAASLRDMILDDTAAIKMYVEK
jgi:hypothetical protein